MAQTPRLRIDPDSKLPLTRQIVEGILLALVSGELKAGGLLPSVRRVAIEIGVHHNTVAEAYRQLAAEGWLELKHGRAPRVLERARAQAPRNRAARYRERLRVIAAQMIADGIPSTRIAAELHALAEAFAK